MRQKPHRTLHGPRPMRAAACACAGFSLIELMLGITLMGVFLALAMPSFNAVLQRYRVGTAAHQIAGALQFARIEAIRTRNNVTVGQTASTADPGCTPNADVPTDWHCGVDVQETLAGNTTPTTLKTIPASSLQALNVQASMGSMTALAFTPMGYAAACTGSAGGANCNSTALSGVDSFIYVWPAAMGENPADATVINTVCATTAGKIRVVPSRVANTAGCNNYTPS